MRCAYAYGNPKTSRRPGHEMIGSRLAHYHVTGHLGSGGMGDVFQATDSRLGRSVALKFLPEAFARDSERVARFEREARVLASLNHPNIAAIYGLEESGERKFLVMELVEGETLAQRITRGPLPLEDALRIVVQITEALEAAHEKGIIHRDLKPANIKMTADGKVKLLDFGLAKAFQKDAENVNLSNSPTMISIAGTNAGVVLGTAAYMSPEQARGLTVDRRTDIFALGCVLYEMLTGRAAFEGDSFAQILARVLERDPDLSLLPAAPPRIREVLVLCLKKDPKSRRADAGDVRIDIEQALRRPQTESTPTHPRTLGTRLAWIAAGIFALVAAVSLAVALRPAPAPPEMRLEITTPATATPYHFAFSPDGRSIVFVASGNGPQRLWLRPLDKPDAQAIPGTDDAAFPFWSGDSKSIGFFANGKLKRVDTLGGPPHVLADAGLPRGGTWNADGTILFAPGTVVPLKRIAASGGASADLFPLGSGDISHRLPKFLPDGTHFLFFVQSTPERQGIYLGSLEGWQPVRLTAADTAGAYLDPDRIIFMRQSALVSQRLDLKARRLSGDPEVVTNNAGYDDAASMGAFSTSANGRVAYRTGGPEQHQLVWLDRSGKLLGAIGEPDAAAMVYPEMAPNGRRVALDRTVENNRDLWLIDLIRGGLTRLTFGPALDETPVWSPDGSQIAFTSSRNGTLDLFVKPANGDGTEQLLLERPGIQLPLDWSKDGQYLLYFDVNSGDSPDLWALPITGSDRKPIAVAATPAVEQAGVFSPDAHWVAYHTTESGRFEVVVQAFPNPTGKWQISTGGGSYPRWSKDGRELYFLALDGNLMATSISSSGSSFEPGRPAALFRPRILATGVGVAKAQYDVSADGRFLINQPVETSASPITLILNWKSPTAQ